MHSRPFHRKVGSRSAFLSKNHSTISRRKSRAVIAVLIGALLYHLEGCGEASDASVVRAAASSVLPLAAGPTALPPNSVGRDFITFALNALLLPLLDDDVPARWADPSLSVDCNDARVTIDGGRLDVGSPVPSTFSVRWHMDGCTPLGEGLELSGDVELRVESDSYGYRANVHPKGLRVISAYGVQTLTEPFMARLAVVVPLRP